MLKELHSVVDAVVFITSEQKVVLFTPVLAEKPSSYRMSGNILNIYDGKKKALHEGFLVDSAAASYLRLDRHGLVVAEVDDEGPVRTTENVQAREG